MSYTKQTWATGDLITAAKMNYIEDGIEAASEGGLPEFTTDDIGKVLKVSPIYDSRAIELISEQTITSDGENASALNADPDLFVSGAPVTAVVNSTTCTGTIENEDGELVCELSASGTLICTIISSYGDVIIICPSAGNYTVSATTIAQTLVDAEPAWGSFISGSKEDVGKVIKAVPDVTNTVIIPEQTVEITNKSDDVVVTGDVEAFKKAAGNGAVTIINGSSQESTIYSNPDGSCYCYWDNVYADGTLRPFRTDGDSIYFSLPISSWAIGTYTVSMTADVTVGAKPEWRPVIDLPENPDNYAGLVYSTVATGTINTITLFPEQTVEAQRGTAVNLTSSLVDSELNEMFVPGNSVKLTFNGSTYYGDIIADLSSGARTNIVDLSGSKIKVGTFVHQSGNDYIEFYPYQTGSYTISATMNVHQQTGIEAGWALPEQIVIIDFSENTGAITQAHNDYNTLTGRGVQSYLAYGIPVSIKLRYSYYDETILRLTSIKNRDYDSGNVSQVMAYRFSSTPEYDGTSWSSVHIDYVLAGTYEAYWVYNDDWANRLPTYF